ncbi:MAG: ribosome biogenesis GTP-binding protein YihA/YsxC [Rhodospirillales bacterium]
MGAGGEADDLERGRKLFAQDCRFIAGAAALDALPPPGLPEVAFAGRSNVGKSSLVNALTGRKTLAKVSAMPGRTQQINFFELGRKLVLVDLPGYGYSKAGKARAAEWTRLAALFLKGRPTLRRVLLLIDARHGPNAHDRAGMDLMDEAAVNFQAVLTKADKAKPGDLDRLLASLARELVGHVAAHPQIAVTSAHDGTGIPALRAGLTALAD